MKKKWTAPAWTPVAWRGVGVAATISAFVFLGQRAVPARDILVSAASSLTEAMTAVGSAFTRTHPGVTVQCNFASSGALQRQIEQGAPVDVFASASTKEMDALQRERRIAAGTRVLFASNRLVLIQPLHSRIVLRRWEELRQPGVKRVAISDPATVPSGRYAQETLTRRKLMSALRPKLVMGENVRQTLTYVADGDVDAGIVFATDARIDRGKVRVVAEAVPGRDHTMIAYPAAVVAGAPDTRAARSFVTFLRTSTAQRILARYGFRGFPPGQ